MENYVIKSRYVYVIGDLHGEFGDLLCMLKRYGISDAAIIVAGDCGFGFSSEEGERCAMQKLRKYCEKSGVSLYFVRGNHDDPSYFSGKKFDTEVFRTMPDYSVVTVKGEDGSDRFGILCVGGATSIDRSWRISGYQQRLLEYMRYHGGNEQEALANVRRGYWEDEAPVYDENALEEILGSGVRIDYVVTHTCPSFCEPKTKDGVGGWLSKDADLGAVLDAERATMDKLSSWLKERAIGVKKWLYGHFHYHNFETIDGVDYIMLDMAINGTCDMYELKEDDGN